MLIEITVFHGYGATSYTILRNIRRVVERLREQGYGVVVREVTVPAIDMEDEFTPFVLVNGVEVYVPAVEVDIDMLASYIVEWVEAYESMIGLPSPPLVEA